MDVTVAIDTDGSITVTALGAHPIDYDTASRLLGDLLLRVHRELTHCGSDDGA